MILHRSVRILCAVFQTVSNLYLRDQDFFMTDLSFFEQAISFVLHIDQHLFALVAEYGALLYLFLFIVVFCETGSIGVPVSRDANLRRPDRVYATCSSVLSAPRITAQSRMVPVDPAPVQFPGSKHDAWLFSRTTKSVATRIK